MTALGRWDEEVLRFIRSSSRGFARAENEQMNRQRTVVLLWLVRYVLIEWVAKKRFGPVLLEAEVRGRRELARELACVGCF